MDHRHLWLRSRRQHAALLVRHEVIKGIRDYFDSHGFVLVDTPIFTPAACEGTSTLFEVNYFDEEKVYLAQSGQLYNEATAMAFGKTYCFGPTFRAEKSKTRRHLTEFWMVEPEMAYADLEDVKRVGEELIVSVVGRVLENRQEELKTLERDVTKLEAIQAPFHSHELRRCGGEAAVEGQRDSMGHGFRQHRRDPAHRRPRPACHRRSFPVGRQGLLFPDCSGPPGGGARRRLHRPEGFGEVIGGGQRIHDLDLLLQRLKEHNLPAADFEWYLDLRRYGSVPHAGFGMGVERFVAWMCGLEHIRETIAFPRMLYRTRP